jgi:hypothetical protein
MVIDRFPCFASRPLIEYLHHRWRTSAFPFTALSFGPGEPYAILDYTLALCLSTKALCTNLRLHHRFRSVNPGNCELHGKEVDLDKSVVSEEISKHVFEVRVRS